MPFAKWTEIESLEHVVRSQDLRFERVGIPCELVTYKGKIKLHGTNACVRVEPDGSVHYQSRTEDITPENDNSGFARWASQFDRYWRTHALPNGTTYYYGEWCGQGINKGCAIHQIGRKVFAVFALGHTTMSLDTEDGDFSLMTEPGHMKGFLGTPADPPEGVYVLPWASQPITLNFKDKDDLRTRAEAINKMVLEVEACDPWVKEIFGVDGVGEGIVFYPTTMQSTIDGWEDRNKITRTMFKAKGEKHRVKAARAPVQVDLEKLNSAEAFAKAFVTDARCEQAVATACDGAILMPNMGPFLAWIGRDVEKESGPELEASGLVWKDVAKAVNANARNWFIAKAKTL